METAYRVEVVAIGKKIRRWRISSIFCIIFSSIMLYSVLCHAAPSTITSNPQYGSSSAGEDTFGWERLAPRQPTGYSIGFRSSGLNYTCYSVACPTVQVQSGSSSSSASLSTISPLGNGILHFIAGVEHKSNFPLLVYRVCEALQWCMQPSNFYISLHYDKVNKAVDKKMFTRKAVIPFTFLFTSVSPLRLILPPLTIFSNAGIRGA
jgi:hypothetical protein